MHDRVRDLAGRDQHHAGHGAVQPVPGDPDRGDGHQQHGPDHDRGERGHLRHGADRRRRVHCGQPPPRQETEGAARVRRVLSPEQERRPRRHASRQLLRRRRAQPGRADVLAGRPQRVRRPQGLGSGVGVQQPQPEPVPDVPRARH